MKTPHLAILLALGAGCCTAQAQQQAMPDMPGMNMGPQSPNPQQPAVRAPNRTKNQPNAMPGDINSMGRDTGNHKAQAAAASEQNSVTQESKQVGTKPGSGSDLSSEAIAMQEVQEPEAVGLHTGSDLPAPELLGSVVAMQPMPLQTFLDMAASGNPTLAQAQRDVDRSKQQARQAGLPPDPLAGYSGEHIRGGSYHGGEEGAFVSQEFVLGRKLALRRDVYLAEGRSNEFLTEMQRARIRDDVGRAFFHALASQESVVVHDRLLKVALDAETNAHELERIGQADASAVLNAEVAAEQAKIDFVDAQHMFLADFAQLATEAGQLALAPHPLTGELIEPPQIDADSIVASDVQQSPAVKRAQGSVAVAEARLKSARREVVPNLNLKAGEWYSGEDLGETNNEAGPMGFAEASVQLPLWNRNQGNVEAAKVELERAQEEVTRVQLMTRHQAEPYAQQYQTARFTAERYRTEILPRARRAYQLEVMKYQQMAQAYPEVLAAQHTLFTLQLSYIHALDSEWQAAVALQNYALMNALEQPMGVGSDSTMLNLPTGGSQ